MAKKIYDILPPKVARKIERGIKEVMPIDRKVHGKKRSHRRKRAFPLAQVLVASSVLLLAVIVFLYFNLQRVTVEIWPATETLSFQKTITADKLAAGINLENLVVPAMYFEEQKDSSEDYPATGNASNEGKATGTITVFNKYSPAKPITLISGTHFLSDSAKSFVTLQKVVVPAGSSKNPGSIDVKVQAEEGGESYNIGPSNFSVPKLAGTKYYYSIYATSKKAMTGGFEGKVKKVTEEDINKAKETLTAKLFQQAKDAITNKISSDYILADGAISNEIVSSASAVKSGTVADKFTYTAKTNTRVIVFKKQDLDEYAKNFIISQMPDSKTFLPESLKVDYTINSIDISSGKIKLDVSFSGKYYESINKNALLSLLKKKNSNDVRDAIENAVSGQILQTKVNFWPFWTKKAPKDSKKIKIELKFD